MSKQFAEFDSTLPKTHKSRSANLTLKKTKGFTLIELLVVISIIALLSTVVLTAVGDARMKARNSAKNSLVLEYVKALELYRSNNISYPDFTTPVCVGYSDSESCLLGYSGSTSLSTSLSTYLPGNFADRQAIISPILGNMSGVLYSYNNVTSIYTLTWILEQGVSSCIDKAYQTNNYFGHTRCDFTLK